ncbi:MAG: hypothetical protein IJK81_13345 [Selenomonadaceae bacterium]|nr:hypothetical protein [Selenomonadaceae bacterium]
MAILNNQVTNAPLTSTRKSPLELMVMQQAMAQNSDPNTMFGLALGKLLRGLFDDWKSRYDARDVMKGVANFKENDRNEFLSRLSATNPQQHQIIQKYLAKNGGNWDAWKNPPQTTSDTTALVNQTPPTSDLSGINLTARGRTNSNLLGDIDFWKQRVTTPENNWNQWSNLFNRAGW